MRKHALYTALLTALSAGSLFATSSMAQEQLTYKSAKAGTSYYQIGVELSEALKRASDGELILTIEESQGSVQNVMEAPIRAGDYIFTAPPGLINRATEATGPFENRNGEDFEGISALFPIPPLTMQFVVKSDESTIPLEALEDKTILVGKGTFSATEGQRYLDLFEMTDKVNIADAELSNASDAIKNGQIDAFVSASSFPAPNIIEVAASMNIALVDMSEEQVEATGATPITIPAGTYQGVDADVHTTSLPVIAWTTDKMDEDTAYNLAKSYWETREALADTAPWWGAISADMLPGIADHLHSGAARYYQEAGLID